MCCLPDGRTVVAACDDGTLIVGICRPLKAFTHGAQHDPFTELGYAPGQGRAWAITRSGSIQELSADTGACIRNTRLPVGSGKHARLSVGGHRLAVVVATDLYVFDVATGLPMYRVAVLNGSESDEIQSLAVSDDGERVVIARAAESIAALLAHDGRLDLLEMASGKCVTLKTDTGLIDSLEVSADGRFTVFGSRGRPEDGSRFDVWDLNLRESIAQQTLRPGVDADGFTFHPDGESLLWCEDGSLRRLRLMADQLPQDLLNTSEVWRQLAVSPAGKFAALFGGSRLDLWDLGERVCLAGFEADQQLTSCRVIPQAQTVMALDENGGINVLRFPFPYDEPELPAAAHRDGLASVIDTVAAVERAGRSGEAADLWTMLAETPGHPAVFRLGLARLLHDAGRSIKAETVLCCLMEQTKAQERHLALNLLLELGTPDGISTVLRSGLGAETDDREAVMQLTAAAEWLARRNELGRLRSAAHAAATGLSRLVAAQVLADIDEAAAGEALDKLSGDHSIEPDLRAIAWISRRSLMPTREWLERTHGGFADGPWPERKRTSVAKSCAR